MILLLVWIIGSLVGAAVAIYVGERIGTAVTVGIFARVVVAAQIFANKLAVFAGYAIPAGVIMYSLSFLITDALSEFHGKKVAQQAVISGFIGSLLLVFGLYVVIKWPAPAFWPGQAAFEQTLGTTWRIVVASLITYLISQSWDVWFYHWIRSRTGDRHLWLRNSLSTITSQLLDSFLFVTIAFVGVFPWSEVIVIVTGQYLAKVLIAVLDTPFLYAIRWARKRWNTGLAID